MMTANENKKDDSFIVKEIIDSLMRMQKRLAEVINQANEINAEVIKIADLAGEANTRLKALNQKNESLSDE